MPVTLSACIPSSPLKKTTKIRVNAVTNSQKPSEIIANAVPTLFVDKYPISHNGDQEYISLYFHQITKQMHQIPIKKPDSNYYYYDYYQRQGFKLYTITKL